MLLPTITFAREYKIGETFSPDQIESYSSFDEIGIIFNDDEGIGKGILYGVRAIVSEKDLESYIRDFLLPLTEVKVITIMSGTPTFTVKNLRIRDNEAIYTDLTINMIWDGLVKVSTTSCKIDSICSEYRKLEKKTKSNKVGGWN